MRERSAPGKWLIIFFFNAFILSKLTKYQLVFNESQKTASRFVC